MKITIHQPWAIHELGRRDNQEDSIYPSADIPSTEQRLFLVCDGMGGHDNSEVASQTVCRVLAECLDPERWDGDAPSDPLIQQALAEVQRQLNTFSTGSAKQMGTTLTLLCLHRGGATMAHIGDSRIYHLRPRERRILYKSRDHSLAYDLYLAGELTREEMDTYERKNVITRALLAGEEEPPRADIVHTTNIQAGDVFLLCSDGVLEHTDDARLVAFFASGMTDSERRQALISMTADSQDNHSAWAVTVAGVDPELGDDDAPHNEDSTKSNAARIEYGENAVFPHQSWWHRMVQSLFGAS